MKLNQMVPGGDVNEPCRPRSALLPEDTPPVLTIPETARLFRCSQAHIYRMAADGTLKSLSLGGRRVIPRAVIEEMLAGVVAGK